MVKTIIRGVIEEIKELATDTGKTVAKQPSETAKQVFRGMIGMTNASSLPEDEYARKQKDQLEKDQKELAERRKRLKELMIVKKEPEPSDYEKAKQEEVYKKQRQAELAKQKQMQQLPTIAPKAQRGSLLAFKKRKVSHIETGKTPGQ